MTDKIGRVTEDKDGPTYGLLSDQCTPQRETLELIVIQYSKQDKIGTILNDFDSV